MSPKIEKVIELAIIGLTKRTLVMGLTQYFAISKLIE